mgnify:FL=1
MLRKHFHVVDLHHMLTFIPFTEKNIRIRYLNNHFSMMNKRTSEQSNHTNMSPSFSFLTHKWDFFLCLTINCRKKRQEYEMKWLQSEIASYHYPFLTNWHLFFILYIPFNSICAVEYTFANLSLGIVHLNNSNYLFPFWPMLQSLPLNAIRQLVFSYNWSPGPSIRNLWVP